MKKLVLIIAMLILCFPKVGNAELYNVQFSPRQSAGVEWNTFGSSNGSEAITTASGQSTVVLLEWTGTGLMSSDNGFSTPTNPLNVLMGNYLYGFGTHDITFSNLSKNSEYALQIYSQGAWDSSGRQIAVNVNGDQQVSLSTVSSASSLIQGQNILTFIGNTGSEGIVNITYNGVGSGGGGGVGSEADINSLQLQIASSPEPKTYLLLSIGLLFFGVMYRKRILE